MNAILKSLIAQVRHVNRRYAKAEIQMTPLVKFCLLALRVYLVLLVALMIYKFVVVVRS